MMSHLCLIIRRRGATDAPKASYIKKDKAYKSQPSKAMQNQMNGRNTLFERAQFN